MGADRKPLACRLFPFRFHFTDSGDVVTASFACPTVIANDGATLGSQARDLRVLHAAWTRAWPEPVARIELVRGRPLSSAALAGLRRFLGLLIDRRDPNGLPDLRANLRRIAAFLEDLSRSRVLRLAPEAFAEYCELMGRHALTDEKPPATRQPSALARLLFRGFLLSAVSVQLHLDPVLGRRPLALRVTLLRLLAHLHGLGRGTADFDLGHAGLVPFSLDDEAVRAIAHRYLRTSFDTLGTGRRPNVVNEVVCRTALAPLM
jgi:hypothetical protein